MSENLPYHDEQWGDLPLPDREEAWQKMQRLLEKEDRRRRFLPFWFWRYALLGMLLAGMATGGYFLLNRNERLGTGTTSTSESVRLQNEKQPRLVQNEPGKKKDPLIVEKGNQEGNKASTGKTIQLVVIKEEKPGSDKLQLLQQQENKEQSFLTRKPLLQKENVAVSTVSERKQRELVTASDTMPQDSISQEKAKEQRLENVTQPGSDSGVDTSATNDSTGVSIAPPADSSATQKPVPKKKSAVVFSAGIGLQQAIAFGGQQTSSYNLNGTKSKFSDHIPSVYLRLQKDRWFLQGELHYKAPQPVKPFAFSQISAYDGASNLLHTERLSVQKLYYHQLPLSIHYFLRPQWSLGAGLVYSRFAGAVTGLETKSRNVVNGGETVATRVVPVKGYKDSFLYQSTTGMILQTDYHWRRISFGLRYTQYLQPFIKYTRPDGAVLNEENRLLQAVLRIRVF